MLEAKDPQVVELVAEFRRQMESSRTMSEALAALLGQDRVLQDTIARLEAPRVRRSLAKRLCHRLRDILQLRRNQPPLPPPAPAGQEIVLDRDEYYVVAENGAVTHLCDEPAPKEETQ